MCNNVVSPWERQGRASCRLRHIRFPHADPGPHVSAGSDGPAHTRCVRPAPWARRTLVHRVQALIGVSLLKLKRHFENVSSVLEGLRGLPHAAHDV